MKEGPEERLRQRLPRKAYFSPTEKCMFRREGDPETGLPFIYRNLSLIMKEIGHPLASMSDCISGRCDLHRKKGLFSLNLSCN